MGLFGPSKKEKALIREKIRIAQEAERLNSLIPTEYRKMDSQDCGLHNDELTKEQLLIIEELRRENEELERKKQLKLAKMAEIVQIDYPSFLLEEELKNPMFSRLIDTEIDMVVAYEILHKENLLKKSLFFEKDIKTDIIFSEEYFYQALLDFYNLDEKEIISMRRDIELKVLAERMGLTIEQYLECEKLRKKEREDIRVKCRKWARAATVVASEYSSFDIKNELSNQQFVRMLENEVDIKIAFEVIHRKDLFVSLRDS